jgi:glycosyltransferase involved in cell wall biosynthesis
MMERSPRVTIASVGLGRIQRGYERYFKGIFEALRNDFDITLYKSAGESGSREKVPEFLRPAMAATSILPLGVVAGGAEYKTYKNDCLAFALTMLPDLLRRRVDVVHVIDYPLAIALLRLRRIFRYEARVIFSDGGLMPPQYYPRADHVHHVAQVHFDEALAFGIPERHMTMVPCGLDCGDFAAAADRGSLREKHGISKSTFVILAVTAIKRIHKRVDHIIEEASRLNGDFVLWIDGRVEDPTLLEMARDKLGSRCRITHVASADVPELYHTADVFVHAALEEGFGLAVCEAGAAGLPVLAHDSPHFAWLVGDRDCLVDMDQPNVLTRRLQEMVSANRGNGNRLGHLAKRIRDRFDWGSVGPSYMAMYRKVAAMEQSANGVRA